VSIEQVDGSEVRLVTDGACLGNPGPGGWAFILRHESTGKELEQSGGERNTTNNRMEIMAVIKGLEALKRPTRVTLVSDSQYIVNAITSWLEKWKKQNWRKGPRGGEPVKNIDLWQRLDELLAIHQVRATWTRGHAGHDDNERCDQLAQAAARAMA
jgi:ribonuclease HI